MSPFSSSRFASPARPNAVPIVSKKSLSISEKIASSAAMTPMTWKLPKRLNWPRSPRSGVATIWSGTLGTFRPQPTGLTAPSAPNLGPTLAIDSMMIATTAVPKMPIRMAPRTFLTTKMIVKIRPKQKVKIGQPARAPAGPNVTNTGPGRTKPESTKPMIVMKRPIPTPIAYFSCSGTAWNTADLNPVSTKIKISTPSRTTRPIASAQVICGANVKATKPFRPRPAATAMGKRPKTPIRIVIKPATKAVAAVTIVMDLSTSVVPPMKFPFMSLAVPMINGLSTTM